MLKERVQITCRPYLGIVALALGTAGTGNPCSSIPTTAATFSTAAATFSTAAATLSTTATTFSATATTFSATATTTLSQHFRGWQTKSTADCGSLQQNRS